MDHASLNISASLLAAAVCFWSIQVFISLLADTRCAHTLSSRYFAVPCLLLLGSALTAWGHDVYFRAPAFFCFGNVRILQRIDSLAAVYLGLLALVGLSVSFFSPGYMSHLKDRINSGHYWSALSFFMLSMALVVSSANAVSFLVFWEAMSLSSLALVASEHKIRRVQVASMIYLGATRIATSFLVGGFLWMHVLTQSWNFSDWNVQAAPLAPVLLILLGFCIKAGIWPFDIWLPYAHPAAPSPVSALMSGVMIKIPLYACIRILIMHNLASPLLGHICLALGLISAVWGVLFAVVQHDLKRLLAYSSVENVGLVLMGIGLSIVGRVANLPQVAAIALTAAVLHSLNHGFFKSLLFLGAGAVDAGAHSRDMLQLGGLGKKMPWTMLCFVLASCCICALPPSNGFVSKWLLYQGLLQTSWQATNLPERSLGLISIGILALVGGLALACFTKAIGVTFLGKPRSRTVGEHASDGGKGMVFAQIMLAALCLCLGLAAGYVCPELQLVTFGALKIRPAQESLFNVPLLTFTLISLSLIAIVYFALMRSSRMRQFITWECGFGDLSPRTQVNPRSFAQPIARLFGKVLRFKLLIEISGSDKRNFPEHIKVEPVQVSPLETQVYLPLITWIQNFAKSFAKVQAGSIHLYLLYVCATLVILLFVGTKL